MVHNAGTSGSARDIVRALSRTPLFSGLDGVTLAALAAVATRRAWYAGAVLFQRGDAGEDMLILVSGRVRLSISTAAGKELVLRHLGPGEVLGEFSLIDGEPRSADATVTEPTAAIVLHRHGFDRVAAAHPQLGLALARHLCRLLRQTNYQMESIALHALHARVARFLLFALREQHGATLPDQAMLRLELSQSDVAAVLGASRPKVNAVFQAMLADGTLHREGTTLGCDVRRLAAATEAPEAG